MATKHYTVTLDDLDPSGETPAAETVPFALDNVEYEIDLSDENAGSLREALRIYIDAARKVSGGRAKRNRAPASNNGASDYAGLPFAEIREWAKANGHEVNDRGRPPAEVVRAWKARNDEPVAAAKPAKRAAAKKTAGSTAKAETPASEPTENPAFSNA